MQSRSCSPGTCQWAAEAKVTVGQCQLWAREAGMTVTIISTRKGGQGPASPAWKEELRWP